MGKIGDLFVRLGLKSDDYKKGIDEAQKKTEGFSDRLGKLKGFAVAAWAAIGASVVKVAQDTISATNAMGDAWEKTMSKMRTSYRSVIAQMSTNNQRDKGWWLRLFNPNSTAGYDVGANAKAAGEAAAKMTEAFDAEFELVNSVKLQRGAIQQELNQLYVDMRDTTLSPSARKAAMERYKSLLEPIAQAEVAVYQNMLNSAVEAWQAGNMDILSRQYTTAEVTDFFTMYGTNPNEARAKYGELATVYETRQNDTTNGLMFDTIGKWQSAQNQMSNIDKEMGKVATNIKKSLNPDVILEDIGEIEDIELDIAEIEFEPLDMSEFKKQTDEIIAYSEKLKEAQERAAQYGSMIEQSIISSTANGLQALTDMMMGIEGADMKQVMAAFLAPFGDTMKQMGSMIMAEGIAMSAFKNSFKTPAAAIAAGAALMAVGAAVSSGLQKMTANPAGGGTTASAGGSSSMASQNYESTLTIEVTGKISGSDILIAGTKQQNKWNR